MFVVGLLLASSRFAQCVCENFWSVIFNFTSLLAAFRIFFLGYCCLIVWSGGGECLMEVMSIVMVIQQWFSREWWKRDSFLRGKAYCFSIFFLWELDWNRFFCTAESIISMFVDQFRDNHKLHLGWKVLWKRWNHGVLPPA